MIPTELEIIVKSALLNYSRILSSLNSESELFNGAYKLESEIEKNEVTKETAFQLLIACHLFGEPVTYLEKELSKSAPKEIYLYLKKIIN